MQYISEVFALPRESYLNIRCKSVRFDINRLDPTAEDWCHISKTGLRCIHDDKISYFIGGYLTREGLFPNLKTVHINYGLHIVDPSEQIFHFCLSKSVTTLGLSYGSPDCVSSWAYQWEEWMHCRKLPIRYPVPHGKLSTLKISHL